MACSTEFPVLSGDVLQGIVRDIEAGYEAALGWRDDLEDTIKAAMLQYIPRPAVMLQLAYTWAELAYKCPHVIDADLRMILLREEVAAVCFVYADSLTPFEVKRKDEPTAEPHINWGLWAINVRESAPAADESWRWSGRLGSVHARPKKGGKA